MKFQKRKIFLSVLLCMTLLLVGAVLLSSCTEGETVDTQGATQGVTDPTTEADATVADETNQAEGTEPSVEDTAPETTVDTVETEGETEDDLWYQDTGVFNEGKVVYSMEVETQINATFPEENLSKPVSKGQTGVVTVFDADFESGDATCDGAAAIHAHGSVVVKDGVLMMPYDDSTQALANDGWTTWSPVETASVNDYLQVQFSANWELRSKGTGVWMSTMVGCYVSGAVSKIPDAPGDGLWFAFHDGNSTITIYHPDNASWPAGWADVSVETGLMEGYHTVDIVCMPDYTTYVYITPEAGGDARCVVTVKFADGKIRVYDEASNLVKEGDATTNYLKGGSFNLFVHGGGAVTVAELSVLACSKGDVIVKKTIAATPTEGNTLGLDITDRDDLVSICYSVWFDHILGIGTEPVTYFNNITEALAGNQPWGGVHAFHYWAKPAQGYYRSSDKTAIRNNMTMLYEAGVDFIVIDLTNANDGYIGSNNWYTFVESPMDAMCDTIMEMRAEGKGTPYVVFWCGTSDGPLYQALYDNYHAVEKWQDCFVYWDNKPFMITTQTMPEDFAMKDLFTVRRMWGLNDNHSTGSWSFLNVNNHGTVSLDANGNPEQVSVAVASQENYMSNTNSAHGRNGGIFWYTQWYYAFEARPKVVGLTWWNEWTAQRFVVDGLGENCFVDNYNQEYSRDIEPMEGGHGDQYYQWLKTYISYYKAGKECPLLVEEGYEKKAERALREAQRFAYQPEEE